MQTGSESAFELNWKSDSRRYLTKSTSNVIQYSQGVNYLRTSLLLAIAYKFTANATLLNFCEEALL